MVAASLNFDDAFEALTEHPPFPWQGRLYKEHFVRGEFPSCSLPTGLGKTSVLAVWLLALAATASDEATRGRVPRRLAYVVNRRTIVDQATREAERLRKHLDTKPALRDVRRLLQSLSGDQVTFPLAISTLRGQFADNGEWAIDPARPAIIIGTVDMIGSRLLFSGYGVGRNRKPLHAGLLGQDTLLIHDEAHLEPAFQKLVDTIATGKEKSGDFGRFRVMPLTATPRVGSEAFELTKGDLEHPIIKRRLGAKKRLELHRNDDDKKTADEIAARAIARANESPGAAILVFVRKVEDLKKVCDLLGKNKDIEDSQIKTLTGTLRGLEREALVKSPVFQRFLPSSHRADGVVPADGTVVLVCTSAGEVGIDISADHMVCDMTTFDSMAQRFGRVNRYGDGDAVIDVVHPRLDDLKADDPYDDRRRKTLSLLKELDGSGSPKAITKLSLEERIAAFSPDPKCLTATDILFDAWALTSVRERLPGRPPVADWLHGVAEWEPPETTVAWRDEVQWVTGALLNEYRPDDLLDVYPLKPHELLKDRSKRVLDELKSIAKRIDGAPQGLDGIQVPVWVLDDQGVTVATLQEVVGGDEDAIANRTLLLPPFAGGLSAGGMLDGKSPDALDVADRWLNESDKPRRVRTWDDSVAVNNLSDMRPVRSAIDFNPEESGVEDADERGFKQTAAADVGKHAAKRTIPGPPGRLWKWYVLPRSGDDDGSRSAGRAVTLQVHSGDVRRHCERMVASLGIGGAPEGRALVFAAAAHDIGKDRAVWQRSIWNDKHALGVVWAKSGNRLPPRELSAYRHEFGSMLDILLSPEKFPELRSMWEALTEPERDLALHIIAAHHGRARPHFAQDEAFDHAAGRGAGAAKLAAEVPRRFGRLQRKYGRWGLAYLESLLRAADAAASAAPSELVDGAGAVVSVVTGGVR